VPVGFDLSREQEMTRETVRAFSQSVLKPRAAGYDRSRQFPRDNWKECAAMGLCGMMVPEDRGGAGFDCVSYVIAIEEVSRACASTGVILSVNNSLFCGPLLRFGTDDQKKRYLAPHARGEKMGAYCLTEPGSGSDSAALRTRAVRKGDAYVLTGTKVFVTNGEAADSFLVYATVDPALKHKGIAAFIVDRGFPGFRQGKPERKLGITCSGSTEIVLEDCVVPTANRLGAEGEGFKIAMATLDGGRIGIAAQALGIARASFEDAIQYAGERKTFGKPIAEHQAIQLKLAEMAIRTEAAIALTYNAAKAYDEGRRCDMEAGMAKYAASEAAVENALEAMRIHGAYGYSKEFNIERYYRDAPLLVIGEGTNELQRIIIARQLVERNRI
jgi:alkylation response protein AidB-like acyl-CoA dehydrogenase